MPCMAVVVQNMTIGTGGGGEGYSGYSVVPGLSHLTIDLASFSREGRGEGRG